MKKLILLLLLASTSALAETKLLLVGGGKRPVEAMKEFVFHAGSEKADILIVPWASEKTEGAENIKLDLSIHTNGILEVVPHRLTEKELNRFVNRLESCSGVFFTGGDQNKLMALIREYKLSELLKKRFREGIIFGGTSAGTAIMSNPMLTGKGDLSVINGAQIELSEGLGLLPSHVIVDQHFIVRNRFNRMAGVILNQKHSIGIAVDEGTSLLVQDQKATVIGPTQVLVFKKLSSEKLEITVVSPKQTITLKI